MFQKWIDSLALENAGPPFGAIARPNSVNTPEYGASWAGAKAPNLFHSGIFGTTEVVPCYETNRAILARTLAELAELAGFAELAELAELAGFAELGEYVVAVCVPGPRVRTRGTRLGLQCCYCSGLLRSATCRKAAERGHRRYR